MPASDPPLASSDATLKRVEREMYIRERLVGRGGGAIAPFLADLATEMTFASSAVVCRAGEPLHHIYIVVRGALELTGAGAAPTTLEDEGAIGLLDVLLQRPRSHTVTALTEVQVLRLVADQYLDFLEEHFEFLTTLMLGAAADLHALSLSLAPDGGFPLLVTPTPGAAHALPEPTNLAQRLGVLRDAPAFRGANMQALVRIAGLSREHRLDEGETLFRPGEAAGKLFIVARGIIEATREQPRLVARFGRGDLVSGYGAFGPAEYDHTATALSPAIALSFGEEALFDVMEEHFELGRSVLAAIAMEFERLAIERERRGMSAPPPGGAGPQGNSGHLSPVAQR